MGEDDGCCEVEGEGKIDELGVSECTGVGVGDVEDDGEGEVEGVGDVGWCEGSGVP